MNSFVNWNINNTYLNTSNKDTKINNLLTPSLIRSNKTFSTENIMFVHLFTLIFILLKVGRGHELITRTLRITNFNSTLCVFSHFFIASAALRRQHLKNLSRPNFTNLWPMTNPVRSCFFFVCVRLALIENPMGVIMFSHR